MLSILVSILLITFIYVVILSSMLTLLKALIIFGAMVLFIKLFIEDD